MFHNFKKLFLFFILIVGGGFLFMQLNKQQSTVGDFSIPEINIKIDELKFEKVPIWYVEDKTTDLVCFSLTFKKAGSAYETTPGLARLLAAMMLEGAGDMDAKSFKEFLLNEQIQLFVTSEVDNFVFVIRTTKAGFEKSIDAIKLILNSIRLAENDLARVKQELILDLEQSQHDPSEVAHDELSLFAYKKHPYIRSNQELIEGTQIASESLLKEHMTNFFAKDNMQMVFVGNIDQDRIKTAVSSIYDMLPDERSPIEVSSVQFDHPGQIKSKFMDIPQTVIDFVLPGISRLNPDSYAIAVWTSALGESSTGSSRFFKEIREKRGLAYDCSLHISNSDALNSIEGSAGIDSGNAEKTIQLLNEEIKQSVDKGLTEDEFLLHQKRIAGIFALSFSSLLSTTNTLTALMNYGFSPSIVKERNRMIKELTLEKVNQLVKEYIHPEKIVFVVVGRENVDDSSK